MVVASLASAGEERPFSVTAVRPRGAKERKAGPVSGPPCLLTTPHPHPAGSQYSHGPTHSRLFVQLRRLGTRQPCSHRSFARISIRLPGTLLIFTAAALPHETYPLGGASYFVSALVTALAR